MTLYNFGQIILDRMPAKDAQEEISEMFDHKAQVVNDPQAGICVRINEAYGDISGELDSLGEMLQECGIGIREGDVTYYGDYSGAYEWNPETMTFEEQDEETSALRDASVYQLIEELERRTRNLTGSADDVWHVKVWTCADIVDNLPEGIPVTKENILAGEEAMRKAFAAQSDSDQDEMIADTLARQFRTATKKGGAL